MRTKRWNDALQKLTNTPDIKGVRPLLADLELAIRNFGTIRGTLEIQVTNTAINHASLGPNLDFVGLTHPEVYDVITRLHSFVQDTNSNTRLIINQMSHVDHLARKAAEVATKIADILLTITENDALDEQCLLASCDGSMRRGTIQRSESDSGGV